MRIPVSVIVITILLISSSGCYWERGRGGYGEYDRGGVGEHDRRVYDDRDRSGYHDGDRHDDRRDRDDRRY